MLLKRHQNDDNKWHVLEHDPFTHTTKWVKFEDGKATIRTTIPDWLANQIVELNKKEQNEWDFTGGWSTRKTGAVVARVPQIMDTEFKKKAGYDPKKGGWFDQDKYNSFLDDPDYRHLRTGGGKIGKRIKQSTGVKRQIVNAITPKLVVP